MNETELVLAAGDLLMELTWKKKGNVIASFLQHEMSILTPWTKSQSIEYMIEEP
jgi:hypothetical protein